MAEGGTSAGYTPPVANADTFYRSPGLSLKITQTSLLANDTDGGAPPIGWGGLDNGGITANGVSLMTDSTTIYYTNGLSVNDSFNYWITNSAGWAATNVVSIITNCVSGSATAPASVSAGTAMVGFAGVPGYTYEVQRSTNVSFTNWVVIVVTNTPDFGLFKVVDNFPDFGGQSPSQAYYRLRFVHVGAPVSAVPVIATQPTNLTVAVGENPTFHVIASSTLPLSYQWYFNNTTQVGATNSMLTITNAQTSNAGNYFVVVANNCGSVTSSKALLTVNPPLPCAPAAWGLVSWWQGEENTFAYDIAGFNDGELEGGIGFAAGMVGQAFNFTDTNMDVRIPASSSLDVGAGDGFTVEGWINSPDVSIYQPIVEWNDGAGSWGVHFYISQDAGPGSLCANIVDTDGYWHQISTPVAPLTNNVFQHVALTYDKAWGVATIYCDGGVIAQQDLGCFTPLTTFPLYLGRRPPGCPDAYTFAGLMDEISLYNRALSPDEIAAIYNAGCAGKCMLTPTAPSIIVQPIDQAVNVGDTATFVVLAMGTRPVSFQWLFNDTNIIGGGTSDTLTLANVQPGQAGNYSVLVTNDYGSVMSSDAILTVIPIPPEISSQPTDQTVTMGDTATFIVAANGSPPLSYQWNFNGTNLVGATNALLTLTDVQPGQAGNYAVLVTNDFGSVTSLLAMLTVCIPPSITMQPTNQQVSLSQSATFSVVASATAPMSCQWYFNSEAVIDATNATMTLHNAQTTRSGNCFVVVTNDCGTVTSTVVVLEVSTPVIPRIAAGRKHTLALKSDRTVLASGSNGNGQCGNGTTELATNLVSVLNLSNVVGIAAGELFGMAWKSDGTAWVWGDNQSGQLGDGHVNHDESAPIQVTNLNSVPIIAMAGGDQHSLALASNATVWAWGTNDFGQLGDGTTTQRLMPVQVTNLDSVTAIAAGGEHSLALKSDGTVWAWGEGDSGRLGNGSEEDQFTAVQVVGLSNVMAIAGGGRHSLALKNDFTVWAWGNNEYGQLGDGSISNRWILVPVTNLSSVIAIAGGGEHSVALKSDGTVWAWGDNSIGQLGNCTTNDSTIPVQVSGLSNVVAIAASHEHNVALKSDGTLVVWGYPVQENDYNSCPVTLESEVHLIDDSDGNGLPDWWEWYYFGHLGVDPNADPDGDGRSNLMEYLDGTDPNFPDFNPDIKNLIQLQVYTPLQ